MSKQQPFGRRPNSTKPLRRPEPSPGTSRRGFDVKALARAVGLNFDGVALWLSRGAAANETSDPGLDSRPSKETSESAKPEAVARSLPIDRIERSSDAQ